MFLLLWLTRYALCVCLSCLHPRICLFPSWMYTGLAYGEQSRELAEALWRDREFQPLDRFSANQAGRQSHQAYISCLLRWGYIHWDLHARRGQSKLQWAEEAAHRSVPLDEATVAALYHGEAGHSRALEK
jgi:hypothetical protein